MKVNPKNPKTTINLDPKQKKRINKARKKKKMTMGQYIEYATDKQILRDEQEEQDQRAAGADGK